MITRKSLADEIDLLDADIKVLNDSKRDCFDAYRDQMIAASIAKPSIKAEIDAVKAAIKRRREALKDEHALIEKDELIDEVFHEITRAPRATRENIEEFDAETGEVFGDDVSAKLVATVATGMQTEIGRKALVKALDIMIEREEAEERRSDGGLNILTKHEDIRTSPGTADRSLGDGDGATVAPNGTATGGMPVTVGETATESTAARIGRAGTEAVDTVRSGKGSLRREPIGPESLNDGAVSGQATASEYQASPVDTHSDQPLTGGDHEEVADSRAAKGEGAPSAALPAAGVTMEYVPPSGVKRLPFAHCFPELSKADYDRLEKDIAANRVQTPIIRQGDVIIDGWARYLISRQYGMSYPIQEYTGSDVLLDVIELQRAARNFTPAQEKKIAADLAKEFPHRADEIMAAFGHVEQPSQEEAA